MTPLQRSAGRRRHHQPSPGRRGAQRVGPGDRHTAAAPADCQSGRSITAMARTASVGAGDTSPPANGAKGRTTPTELFTTDIHPDEPFRCPPPITGAPAVSPLAESVTV